MEINYFVELITNTNASYQEFLAELDGFKVAIDADLLLSKVKVHSAAKSLQESNTSVDKKL